MKNFLIPLAVLAFGVIAYANDQETDSTRSNPLRDKVVLINPKPGVHSHPRENVRIKDLAGKKFAVYTVKPEDGIAYDSWIAIDDISSMRVFANMESAKSYLTRITTRYEERRTSR